MATAKVNINDFPRGTTPPFTIKAKAGEVPFSLVGSTIVMTVRNEKWEDSETDATAVMKRRARFWQVGTYDDLVVLITDPTVGDIAWVDDIPEAFTWDGESWVEANSVENDITNGVYTIVFTRAETMVPVGKYYYSIDIELPNGRVGKLVKGKIAITDNTVNEVY